MGAEPTLDVFHQTVQIILLAVSVILVPALIVGLTVSVFQAATQINEMTLSFIPKLLITMLTLMFTGPWLFRIISDFALQLYAEIPILLG